MEMEIICISSDDEFISQKNLNNSFGNLLLQENRKSQSENSKKTCNTFIVPEKGELLSNEDEKVKENGLKRKKMEEDEKIYDNIGKKSKLNLDQDIVDEPINKSNNIMQSNKDKVPIIQIPKLVVKEKKKISYITHDIFPLFISLCLQKSKVNEKKDMEKIVDKLKRRYENLDPVYATSEKFALFLNEKREAIMNNDNRKYVYIGEVMNEMKKRIKDKSHTPQTNEAYDAIPSTSYAANSLSINNATESDYEDANEENASPRTRRKIKQILQAMAKCEGVIKTLEEAEVEFDKDNDSNYIKLERYKQRMVELYNKLCELTGDNSDAGRVYLRPKYISTTRIVSVDQAITNFINSKITQRNQMKKLGTLANDLIFPDYRDILECVSRCNDKRNLGLDRRKQEQMAKKAFVELGEHLQRIRRNDYWDTFSLYLENKNEDPAVKDKDLAKKLADNRAEGEKRLTAIFEKYAKKQEQMKDDDDGTTSEEEEESIVGDEDNSNKDKLFICSSSNEDSNSKEDIDTIAKVKENGFIEKSKNTISITNENKSINKNISKTVAIAKQEKLDVKIKIVKESQTTVSKDINKTIRKIIHEPCTSNTIDVKTQENSLTTLISSTADCTKDLTEVVTEDLSKVINPVIKVTEDVADITTRDLGDMITEDATKLIAEDVVEVIMKEEKEELTGEEAEVITGNVTEVITGDVTEVITEDVTDVTIESMPNDKQLEEEKKPLLRVRSFAKPPTTWEDNTRQKMDKAVQENAPKQIVDLTNETTTKVVPLVAKSLQIGNKIIPIKNNTLVIPTSKNIISIQNITNNYHKVDTQTGKIITPVQDIHESTIIRMPSVQSTTSRQNQPQNANNEMVLRIIQTNSNKSIVVNQKTTVQPVSKQTNVLSPIAKPK